ncbi:methyltransferase domain-containing protein [Candidatus Saccharibacteria bacterium]|nr:methyltransferase domain-containing protein [Candidatus Saccharibacteria bacterium]
MKYLAVLGRQPEISIAEIEAQCLAGPVATFSPTVLGSRLRAAGVPQVASPAHFEFISDIEPKIDRFGGVLKLAIELEKKPLEFLQELPEGKITIGVSDYSKNASRRTAAMEALKLKKILVRHGRSVRVVENKDATLSTATSLHNGLSGKNKRKVELIKANNDWYKVIGVQDIDAYTKRDQARPARDAKVGMLPPKLAQILINLCGPLPEGATVLDPFCGTGVVLQEALLMGYRACGTDISERMVEYSDKNLKHFDFKNYEVGVGDATSFHWNQPIDAVACEGYLGKPFAKIPSEMELKEQKQECGAIVLGFLKNLADQVKASAPVTIAVPAWLRKNKTYERLDILDLIDKLGYNVENKSREGLLYHRDNQVVARDIIILRKK